jgi:hypothetical protein
MERHFFDPEDLYLCKNVARVFETLSVLSHSPKVRKSGVPGFPKKEKQLAKKLKREMSNYEELVLDSQQFFSFTSSLKDAISFLQQAFPALAQYVRGSILRHNSREACQGHTLKLICPIHKLQRK